MLLSRSSSLAGLLAGAAQATVFCNCRSMLDLLKCNSALNEVATVASTVIGALKDPTDPIVKAALGAIFTSTDVGELTTTYGKIKALPARTDLRVTIYCTEDHVSYDDEQGGWVDNAFTYYDQKGEQKLASVFMEKATNANNKPGDTATYTKYGTERKLADGTKVDCTNQAHIVLSGPVHLNPSEAQFFDFRSLSEIKSQGIDQNHNSLDYIKSLSYVILHELTHIVGGLFDSTHVNDPTQATPILNINDGPEDDTYGYEKCKQVNMNRKPDAVFPEVPYLRADCLAILAKALFLDRVQGVPQYWSVGAVGKDGKELVTTT